MPAMNEVFENGVEVILREFRNNLDVTVPRFNVKGTAIFLPKGHALPAIDGVNIKCRSSTDHDHDSEFFVEREVDAIRTSEGRFLFMVEGDSDHEKDVFAYPKGDPRFPSATVTVDGKEIGMLSSNVPRLFENMKFALADSLGEDGDELAGDGAHDAAAEADIKHQAYLDKRANVACLVQMLKTMAEDVIMPTARWDQTRHELSTFLDADNTVDAQRDIKETVKINSGNLEAHRNRFADAGANQADPTISPLDKINEAGITKSSPYDQPLNWSRIGHEAFNYGVRVVGEHVFGQGFNVKATDVLKSSIPIELRETVMQKLNNQRHVGRAAVSFPQIPGYQPDVNLYELDLGDDQGSCAAIHVVDHSGHYLYAWPSDKVDLRADMKAEVQVALPAPNPERDNVMAALDM